MSPNPEPHCHEANNPFCNINHLPTEILLNIFSYLPKDHLLTTLPHVCARWASLHTDPSLYRSLEFTVCESYVSTSLAVHLLHTAQWLTCLRITCRHDTNAILEHLGPHNPNLETLLLENCRGSPVNWDISSESFENVLKYCTRLRHLSLEGSSVSCSTIYMAIGLKLTYLRTIDFGDMSLYVISNVLLNIADNCRRLEELRVSHYSNAHITDEVIEKFCVRFKDSLRVLRVEGYAWSDSSLKSLSNCRKLETLLLYNMYGVSDRGVMGISNLPNMSDIVMRKAKQVTSYGWVSFLGSSSMKNIERLAFDDCKNVNDAVIEAVSGLARLSRLKVLNAPDVTEECWLKFVCQPSSKRMTHLALCYCGAVTSQVVQKIKENLDLLQCLAYSKCSAVVNEDRKE